MSLLVFDDTVHDDCDMDMTKTCPDFKYKCKAFIYIGNFACQGAPAPGPAPGIPLIGDVNDPACAAQIAE